MRAACKPKDLHIGSVDMSLYRTRQHVTRRNYRSTCRSQWGSTGGPESPSLPKRSILLNDSRYKKERGGLTVRKKSFIMCNEECAPVLLHSLKI